jgi:hypothetical protein
MTEERKPPMSIDELEAAALLLPEEEREELIARLSASRTYAQPVQPSWLDEAERRMELVRAGRMRLIDADEVLADPEYDD